MRAPKRANPSTERAALSGPDPTTTITPQCCTPPGTSVRCGMLRDWMLFPCAPQWTGLREEVVSPFLIGCEDVASVHGGTTPRHRTAILGTHTWRCECKYVACTIIVTVATVPSPLIVRQLSSAISGTFKPFLADRSGGSRSHQYRGTLLY